jgi:hypothetical protein
MPRNRGKAQADVVVVSQPKAGTVNTRSTTKRPLPELPMQRDWDAKQVQPTGAV